MTAPCARRHSDARADSLQLRVIGKGARFGEEDFSIHFDEVLLIAAP